MQNFITLGLPLLREKFVAQKRKEEKNNPKNSGQFSNVFGQRMHSARTISSLTSFCRSIIFF